MLGYRDRSEDQGKIRMAVGLRRVDPRDVPASAKTPLPAPAAASTSSAPPVATQSPASQGPMSQKKRKAMFGASEAAAGPSSSQRTVRLAQNRPLRPLTGVTRFQIEEDEVEEVVEQEESIDELYVMLKSSIVGIQYYKGESPRLGWA